MREEHADANTGEKEGGVKAAAVVYVRHLERMRSFYGQCFGFEVADGAAGYCVLESDAWSLSLVLAPDDVASRLDLSAPAHRRAATPIKLAFYVPSIEDLRSLVDTLGGEIDPRETAWDFRGLRHCDGVDPEGNVLELLETLAGLE